MQQLSLAVYKKAKATLEFEFNGWREGGKVDVKKKAGGKLSQNAC